MSKLILTIDTPDSCHKCPLFSDAYTDMTCRGNGQRKELSKLHDIALDYDLDIQITTDKIAECREKMFKEKDTGKLKSIVLLLDALIYEAGQYKEWIEQMTDTNIDSEDEKENDRRMQTM